MFEIDEAEPIEFDEKEIKVNPFNLSSLVGEEDEKTDLVSLIEESSKEE